MKKSNIDISKSANLADSIKIIGDGELIIGSYTSIEDNVLIDLGNNGKIVIGKKSKIKYGSVLRSYDGNIDIGNRTSVGEYSILAGHGGLKIGHTVIIAGHCHISAANHIYHSNDAIRFQGETTKGISIDDGVWLGAKTVVLDGIKIGCQTVVGAGSIVTKTLPSDVVAVGSPCKVLKSRTPKNGE